MKKGTVALSSLTMGVSAAALIGVSQVSVADNPAHCDLNFNNCYLGTYPTLRGVGVMGEWWHQDVEAWVAQVTSYFTQSYFDAYGNCAMAYIPGHQDAKCGCSGNVSQYVLGFTAWDGDDPSTWNVHYEYAPQSVFQLHDSQCWFPT